MKTVEINGWEYEIETHDLGSPLEDIKIPKGWQLWTFENCIEFHNNLNLRKELNLEDCWFFIEQLFRFNKKKGLVAGFGAGSGRALLYCDGWPGFSYSGLGVRFCRKLKKVRK